MNRESSDAGIDVRDIGKVYDGSIRALDGVDFHAPAGLLTSLIGPSGCGKTTLLKLVAGLLEPTQGEILVDGKKIAGPGSDRALVFQDFALLPWASVLRNVSYGLELRGVGRDEREAVARRHIDRVGLSGFEHRFPHELSGGMKQRVGLARALAVDAPVLLMDEPFSQVDEQTRRKFQEDLRVMLSGEDRTVLFVTHSIEEAAFLSDRIVLLSPRPGRVTDVIDLDLDRSMHPDRLRRSDAYVDTVDRIWQILRSYLT
jgi:NitT/TauT family transport system ATP-binding protein